MNNNANIFCRTRGLDLFGLTTELSNYCAGRSSLIARPQTGKTAEQICDQAWLTIDFDRYKKSENSRAKPSRASARHIDFVIYFKIAQICILRYNSIYCKQMETKSNCLLVKRLNVKKKTKIICSVADRKPFVGRLVVSVVWRSHMWLVTINIPGIF